MNQNWAGARTSTGNGGSEPGGGRGGDAGSHNRWASSARNSNNDNSHRQRIVGDNAFANVDQGDKFTGQISNSAVGGRENSNTIYNGNSGQQLPAHGQGEQKLSVRELELNDRLAKAREKLAAKKEKERLKKIEDELKELEALTADD